MPSPSSVSGTPSTVTTKMDYDLDFHMDYDIHFSARAGWETTGHDNRNTLENQQFAPCARRLRKHGP
jgi:hypothetical protein